MIRNNEYPVKDLIVPKNVLVSVADKKLLEVLIPGLKNFNPDITFFSTTGTGEKIKEILGPDVDKNYISIEEYTGAPEMDGGLVKTLHPKIYGGLLPERGNPKHEEFLYDIMSSFGKGPGVYIDMLVGSFYQFSKAIYSKDATAETARIHIDVGVPSAMRAAFKNWHSVAILSDPSQYHPLLKKLYSEGGISASYRFELALHALSILKQDVSDIFKYFSGISYERDVLPTIALN